VDLAAEPARGSPKRNLSTISPAVAMPVCGPEVKPSEAGPRDPSGRWPTAHVL